MTSPISGFFKGLDRIGSGVTLNYNGSSGFGTIFGGCLSIMTWLFFLTFTGLQLYLWQADPNYTATAKISYLDRTNPVAYTIPTTSYMPTITIRSKNKVTGEVVYNDQTLWQFFWISDEKMVASIDCKTMIDESNELSDDEKNAFYGELLSSSNSLTSPLCPNITQFNLQGNLLSSVTSDTFNGTVLSLFAKLTGAGQASLTSYTHEAYVADINRYYNADFYRENGFEPFISQNEQVYTLDYTKTLQLNHQISKTEDTYYSLPLTAFDPMAAFDFISPSSYFPETFTNYQTESTQRSDVDLEAIWLKVMWTQNRKVNKVDWKVMSLDIILGVIGGLTTIVWGFLCLVFGSYETFKLENSLIGAVYPTAPLGRPDADHTDEGDDWTPKDQNEARETLMHRVAQRGQYFFNYSDYLCSAIIRCIFCSRCCRRFHCVDRRISKLERHENASQRLNKEIDVVTLLQSLRVGQFTAKMVLKKHQRAMVTNFKRHQLTDLDFEQPTHQADDCQDEEIALRPSIQGEAAIMEELQRDPNLTETQLVLLGEIAEQFKPESNAADLSILYEVTGYQADTPVGVDFWQNYEDFETVLGTVTLVNTKKDEKTWLSKKRKVAASQHSDET